MLLCRNVWHASDMLSASWGLMLRCEYSAGTCLFLRFVWLLVSSCHAVGERMRSLGSCLPECSAADQSATNTLHCERELLACNPFVILCSDLGSYPPATVTISGDGFSGCPCTYKDMLQCC